MTEHLASVIIVTYNHQTYLDACLRSVLRQEYPHEVIVVDNCSADGSARYVKEHYPDVTVISNKENGGYGAGNNIGVRHANGTYVVILNPDVYVEKNWLSNLIRPIQQEGRNITTSKILLYDGSEVNTFGTINHFTGLTFTRELGSDPAHITELERASGVSGACFAIRKEDYELLGGFDENFFVYNEDSDFSWRANLMNFRILSIPDSVVYHDYTLSVSPEKIFHLEKGRYMILRKYLSLKDLLLLSPSLLSAEVLTFGYAILRHGRKGFTNKMRALIAGMQADVSKFNGNKEVMFSNLEDRLPENQLTSHRIERQVISVANRIFQMNFGVMK
jgi:GT2 family glycosyltransferase